MIPIRMSFVFGNKISIQIQLISIKWKIYVNFCLKSDVRQKCLKNIKKAFTNPATCHLHKLYPTNHHSYK